MKLAYRYIVHGFSQGMMLSNTITGEWCFNTFDVGSKLNGPNSEVTIEVLDKTYNTVTINIRYRKNEKTLIVSSNTEEMFNDEANAYGFTYLFIIKE